MYAPPVWGIPMYTPQGVDTISDQLEKTECQNANLRASVLHTVILLKS